MLRAQENQCLCCVVDRRQEGGAGRQGGQVGGCQSIPGRAGGGVDQGSSSSNGEESLGLEYVVRSVEEGGLQGDSQVFGPSNWMAGDAVYCDED